MALTATATRVAGREVMWDSRAKLLFVRCPECERRIYGREVAHLEASVEQELENRHY